ncbi:MAG: radical SAM protein [Anaerolineae bacterium]|nr:radical SAM protein [Gemmatimonadaceae bacterium]
MVSARTSRPRVLLVSANRERQPFPVVPNGVACVASALEAAGHAVRVEDLCFARDPHLSARRSVREFQPDAIGISVRNIDNSDLVALRHYTPEAADILNTLRAAAPEAAIMAGGAAFGVAPEGLLNALELNHAVAGDGERATVALVEALAAGRTPAGIPGVVHRENGTVTAIPPRGDADIDALPAANLDRWLNLRSYERHGGTVPIQTKRGCVFKCVYCTYLNVEGWGYRLRSPELVADEIEHLYQQAGTRHFEFVDSTFNAPPRHAAEICESIIRRKLRVQLDTTNFTPANAPDYLLAAMRRAGFRWLGITAESASDTVLQRLQKGFDAARVRTVAEDVQRAGIGVLWVFLVGGPGETTATIEETLKFAEWRLNRGDAVYVTVGVRVYPGTEMRRIAIQEGIIASDDPLLVPTFYMSPHLRVEDTVQRLRQFAAVHPRFMFSADSRSRLLPYLTGLASLLRLPKPHWRYMGIFQRLARAVA